MNKKKEEALNKRLLAIKFLLKVIQAIVISVNTHGQKMTEIGNKNIYFYKKDKWNYYHHFPIFHFWGIIIVYYYYIWLKVLFGLKKQVDVLTSLFIYI